MPADAPKTRSRATNRLAARQVETATEPGYYIDGGGLLLHVSNKGGKRWLLRFTSPLTGKRREMGLGPAGGRGKVTLADARDAADAARRLVRQGIDPIQHREEEAERLRAEAARAAPKTFGAFTEEWLDENLSQFRNSKHRQQWRNTLTTYATPIWNTPLPDVTTDGVLAALRPIWTEKTETASRVRERIERILDAASTVGLRTGENPARWKGHLANLLPKPARIKNSKPRPAVALRDAARWWADLSAREGMAARALQFAALTGARSGEVRGMTWDEIDRSPMGSLAGMWIVPAPRMKTKKVHRVPLTAEALAFLDSLPRLEESPYVFFSPRGGMLSDMSLSAVMRRMHEAEQKEGRIGYLDPVTKLPAVPHGLRATFRTWAAERGFDGDMAEVALSHNVGTAVARVYQRSDMLERRRDMMAAWSDFLKGNTPLPGDAIPGAA